MSKPFAPQELTDEALELIAGRFKALSDPLRLKLIIALETGEKNVTELVAATGKLQTNVSRQLQHLMDSGIVARRRKGSFVYYRIADEAIFELCRHVCGSLQRQYVEHGKASKLFDV
jgi:ArsR family transcriptional regulator